MRILLSNKFYYRRGGDCIYMLNLEQLLKTNGHDVAVFAMDYPENLDTPWKKYFPQEMGKLMALTRPFGSSEVRRKFNRLLDDFKPDVVHLNNIHTQLSPVMAELAHRRGVRVVWTLHDLWPATAICHYPGDCVKYRTGCSACPMLNPNPLVDLAKRVARRKGKVDWRRVTFVGCSEWIARTARESVWLREARFVSIPNPIDTTLFRPIGRREARQRLGLSVEKRLILFAAAKLSDTRKGAAFLLEACRSLAAEMEGELEIILMGSDATELSALSPVPVRALGYISGAAKLAEAYSCADLFVIPSLEDNLPNTIMEAMACGTPCVGFRTGGIPEMIDHAVNGYVSASRDSADLARGIAWVLRHPEPGNLSAACREKVMRCYQESVVAKKYIALYQKLIQEKI